MFSVRDKIILITGAGSGLGAATAVELHRRGAIPVLLDCDEKGLQSTAQTIGGNVMTIALDVTNVQQCESAVCAVIARHERIDIAWANAGIASLGPLMYTDPAAWRRCFEVNVFGVFNIVRAALPEVIRQCGYVAVTASVSSFAHPPAVSAYAASKAAVEAMCNAWRIELAAHGVGVGIIHASWIKTPLMAEGNLHPAFQFLRSTMPSALNRETDATDAARRIADGFESRRRRIWIPGWVRFLYFFRVVLHTRPAERQLLQAAPEIEKLFIEGMKISGAAASSFPPREYERVFRSNPDSK